MRIGVFGGSFNPVHYGHLLLAETSRESLKLDQLWFVPAAMPPHRRPKLLASAPQRVEMLHLAIGDHPAFEIKTVEIDRGGMSYTVETLEAFQRERPEVEWYLILGADSVHDLPNWHLPQRICELATLACAHRAGREAPDFGRVAHLMSASQLEACRNSTIEMPQIELSSTELRQRVHDGRSIRYRTPRSVERYIATHNLYAANEGSE